MHPGSRFPFTPYPEGWFAVSFSADLPPGGVRSIHAFGQQLVLFRTASGQAVVSDAFCPHLGAHLGYGGRVEGEVLICPFHGFGYGPDGTCRQSPYGVPTPTRLRVLPLHETHGVILLHHDDEGAPPAWRTPELPTEGWTPLASHHWRIRTHPQETTENSVDAGHLAVLHGFSDLETTRPLTTDGPYLHTAYRMTRHAAALGLRVPVPIDFDVHVHGLGHSHVELHMAAFGGLRGRLLVLPTPIDGEYIDLRIGVAVEDPRLATGWGRLLGLVPFGLAAKLVRRISLAWAVHDVQRDVAIWENKRYLEPPALARGDGPIGPYRRWCRQFYGEGSLDGARDRAGSNGDPAEGGATAPSSHAAPTRTSG